MNDAYQIILKVDISHEYYKDTTCRGLKIVPNATSSSVLTRFGLKFYPYEGGFEILYPANRITQLLRYVRNALHISCFEFGAIAKNEAFRLFTEIPMNRLGFYSYDSRRLAGESENDSEMKPVFVEDSHGSIVLNFKIHFDDLINGENTYQVKLNSRRTCWEYYVFNQEEKYFENLQIKSKGDHTVVFVNKGPKTMENGQTATIFSSGNTLLSLSEYSIYQFDLVNIKSVKDAKDRSNTVFNGLPVPRPENIETQDSGEEPVASMIYVYV